MSEDSDRCAKASICHSELDSESQDKVDNGIAGQARNDGQLVRNDKMNECLTLRLLPARMICKDFIGGMDACNYEKYLLEVVNASSHFKKRSCGFAYDAPNKESNGENDCCSKTYSLDFKLLVSETAMRARNLFSSGITEMCRGVLMSGPSKIGNGDKNYRPIEATIIHAALRSKNLVELKSIRNSNIKCQGEEKDIKAILKTMETPKHLLLFFPYEFSYSIDIDFNHATTEIISALNTDLVNIMKFRTEVANRFDTYLVFLYAECFVVTTVADNKLFIVDVVPTKLSKTFIQLKDCNMW